MKVILQTSREASDVTKARLALKPYGLAEHAALVRSRTLPLRSRNPTCLPKLTLSYLHTFTLDSTQLWRIRPRTTC